jgi:hypothetical protein
MHTNTEARWDQVREMRPFILEMLPFKPFESGKELRVNNDIFDEYEDPIDIMARRVFNSMKNYNNHYFITPDLDYLSKPIPSLKKNNYLI